MIRIEMENNDFERVYGNELGDLSDYISIEVTYSEEEKTIAIWGQKRGVSVLLQDEIEDEVGIFQELLKLAFEVETEE
ncbi:MAG: hypothetical protein RR420_08495 [Anaerovoracaceae bacterium]